MNSSQRIRARIIFVLLALGAGIIGSSLYMTQIVRGETYAARASKQYIRPTVSLFDRGTIFFRSKDGTKAAAAAVSSGYLVFINPMLIVDPAQTFEALSEYIDLDRQDFIRRASQPRDPYEELAHHVTETVAQSISSLGIKGVSVTKETWRSYPGGSLAAHTLGLIGENSTTNTIEGRYGLERTYESTLARLPVGSSVNIFAQLFSGLKSSAPEETKPGDVVSTIEPTVQKYLERVLTQTSTAWKPDEIGGIIIDPQTGEIAALAASPGFDPNDTSDIKNVSVLSNPLVEHVYEMGSIMKPLTMATGLDTAAIKPNSTYDDTGTMTLSDKKISNYDGKARGITDMQQILSQSLNVGVATIALKVGKDDFSKYFLSFGLGDKTGIDEPNEATGIVGNLKTGRDVEIATAAYGQGIAISPIAMTRALSVLANGGYLIQPHVVKEIDYTDGTSKLINPEKGNALLQKTTVDNVTRMLVTVVDTALKKGAIKNDHYSVAAKTGTAQIPDHTNGGYYQDRYLHSFFGYFPAYNPKFLVFLYQIHPKGAQYASETLTDPFSDIEKFLIDYYNIPPDR